MNAVYVIASGHLVTMHVNKRGSTLASGACMKLVIERRLQGLMN